MWRPRPHPSSGGVLGVGALLLSGVTAQTQARHQLLSLVNTVYLGKVLYIHRGGVRSCHGPAPHCTHLLTLPLLFRGNGPCPLGSRTRHGGVSLLTGPVAPPAHPAGARLAPGCIAWVWCCWGSVLLGLPAGSPRSLMVGSLCRCCWQPRGPVGVRPTCPQAGIPSSPGLGMRAPPLSARPAPLR